MSPVTGPHDQWNIERQFINVRQQVKMLRESLQNSTNSADLHEQIRSLTEMEKDLLDIEVKFKRSYTE